MAKKSFSAKSKLFIEVLQNGVVLAKTSRPHGKKASLALTNRLSGDLCIPLYPMANDIEIFDLSKSESLLYVQPTWEGFINRKGLIEELKPKRRAARAIALQDGDFGSIASNDLRIVFRIGREHRARDSAQTKTSAYRGKLWSLWIGQAIDAKVLSIGFFAALVVFSGIIYGLLARPDDRPQDISDLGTQYPLPFIHPDHLKNLPEALQENLNRANPLASAKAYYGAFTSLVLGFDTKPTPLLFQSSTDMYQEIFATKDSEIDEAVAIQSSREANQLKRAGSAIMSIPSVTGESFAGGLLRLNDKLALLHESLELNLKLRRETTKEFTADKGYDFNEYKNPLVDDKAREQLAKIKVWSRLSNEDAMYQAAQGLAKEAIDAQSKIKRFRDPILVTNRDNASPIAIPTDIDYASFIDLSSYLHLNDKLLKINASVFGTPKAPEKIQEPLVGEIDPSLIEKTIAKKRFELQLCYELALRRNQRVNGSMQWQWRLDSRGSISDLALLSTSIDDRNMIGCIRGKISRWKFPRPRRGSVEITYPFHFTKAKG